MQGPLVVRRVSKSLRSFVISFDMGSLTPKAG